MSEAHPRTRSSFSAQPATSPTSRSFPPCSASCMTRAWTCPIVGVAKAGWTLDQFKARAKDSIDHHGGADAAGFAKFMALLRYVDGDYNDPQTFELLKQALGGAKRPLHYLAIPPSLFGVVVSALAAAGLERERPAGGREAVRARPRIGGCAQPHPARAFSRGRRFSASTTISARSRSRTSSIRASPTRSSSLCGTAISSATSRSPWPSPSACRIAAPSTIRPGRCSMSCRTTSCRSSPT